MIYFMSIFFLDLLISSVILRVVKNTFLDSMQTKHFNIFKKKKMLLLLCLNILFFYTGQHIQLRFLSTATKNRNPRA